MALAVLMRFASLFDGGNDRAAGSRGRSAVEGPAACGLGFVAGFAPYLCWLRIYYGGFLTTFREGWLNFEGLKNRWFFDPKDFAGIFGWITLAGLALWIGNRGMGEMDAQGKPSRRWPCRASGSSESAAARRLSLAMGGGGARLLQRAQP